VSAKRAIRERKIERKKTKNGEKRETGRTTTRISDTLNMIYVLARRQPGHEISYMAGVTKIYDSMEASTKNMFCTEFKFTRHKKITLTNYNHDLL